MNNKFLYFAFQSSQSFEPTSQELVSFQRKYKKDYLKRELFEGEELLEQYRLRGWKHPRYSSIISFIVAFEIEDSLRVRYFSGAEKDVLQEFNNILIKSQDYTLVTFDAQITLPYLGIRMLRNGFVKPTHIGIKYQGYKPWDLKCLDLQNYYDGAGNYKSSLKDIADDLGLKNSEIIEFEDEFTYYNSNDIESLKKSAIQKVEVMSQSHRILNNLPKLQTVLVEESVKDVEEEKPKDWLKELYYKNEMISEIKEGLKQQIFGGKKKPTKKEKEKLFEIIRGVYVLNDFVNGKQDSKTVIEKKEKEIKELLEI